MTTLASTVATLRRERGLTLLQFGKLVGWSFSQVSDIEHGRRSVSLKAAARLATALGRDPATFVRLVLQERLDAAGVALTVLVQPVGGRSEERHAAELDVRTWEGDKL